MSTAAAQAPAIPPRPARSQDKDTMPRIPPRPAHRRIDRSVSPNPDRYAPSPLNDSLLAKSPRSSQHFVPHNGFHDPIDRSRSVDLPSVGEEGREYATLADGLSPSREQTSSPEHTRTVGEDIKLHAPKPSLPPGSAKQRVAAVTRTDSDRAAAYGIGRPSSEEPRSLKKKASTVSQLSNSESHVDDEHGIPEIGQQVPMYPNAGDVQAPSPAPSSLPVEAVIKKHHNRKTSARGNLPPGSYGLHGHGSVSTDKLDKAYYEKHPDQLLKEHVHHHYDRANDFSMSSDALNKIVRETASRGAGQTKTKDFAGTPSEQVGWQAIEESASRMASPRPGSVEPGSEVSSPQNKTFSPAVLVTDAAKPQHDNTIHVEEPNRRRSVMFSDDEQDKDDSDEPSYTAPILADDEVAKGPSPQAFSPAVAPPPERRGSAFEMEEPRSRPTSRPASIYRESPFEHQSTPLEDVKEYEPLFEDDKAEKINAPLERVKSKEHSRRFPSRDIWEDAPNSVHYTAEVSTPDLLEQNKTLGHVPQRDNETPAAAFARHQEELAEKESKSPESFLHPGLHPGQKPKWIQLVPHVAKATGLSSHKQRFPSKDVWEDTPDSLQLETTVSTPQQETDQDLPVADRSPEVSQRPARKTTDPSSGGEKPAVPERPKPKLTDETAASPPTIPERPKPQIPARPVKAGPTSGGQEPADAAAPSKQKPAVPVRPVGGKIAALQAGFMSDLNKKLGLGPQAPKKEEAAPEQDVEEEKEKAPLVDARKGRARGPQRRAPGKSPSPATALSERESPVLRFSDSVTFFSVDPDEGVVTMTSEPAEPAQEAESTKESEPSKPASETSSSSQAQNPQTDGKEEGKESSTSTGTAAEEVKSLATNMAGETVVAADVKKEAGGGAEPKRVEEVGGEAE